MAESGSGLPWPSRISQVLGKPSPPDTGRVSAPAAHWKSASYEARPAPRPAFGWETKVVIRLACRQIAHGIVYD